PTSYSYQWQRCSPGCSNVGAASSVATYALTGTDVGSTIQVVVVASNAGGPSAPATSNPTAQVASAPVQVPSNQTPPTISGTPQAGQTLTADPGQWTNSPTGYSYQWQRCSPGCSNVGAASSVATYALTSTDVGSAIQVVVTASNASGPSTPVPSAPTATVTAATSGGTFGASAPGALSNA